MHWNSSTHAGFTTGTPWIKVNPRYPEINVEDSLRDEDSVLRYYQRLIALRKKHLIFVYGDYQPIVPQHPQVLAFVRMLEEQFMLVLINMKDEMAKVQLEQGTIGKSWPEFGLLINNYKDAADVPDDEVGLKPFEARIYLTR